VQLTLVSICLATAWLCGRAELSEELGAFLAGAIVAAAERSLVAHSALAAPLAALASDDGTPRSAAAAGAGALAQQHNSNAAAAAAANGVAAKSGGCASDAAPVQAMGANIEPISNVLTALFIASIGLIMSPVFLWHHAAVLLAGTAVVMAVKAAVVAGVVRLFGVPARTSWAAGLTMAHTGEFSFVLLSMAHQLELLPETVRGGLVGLARALVVWAAWEPTRTPNTPPQTPPPTSLTPSPHLPPQPHSSTCCCWASPPCRSSPRPSSSC